MSDGLNATEAVVESPEKKGFLSTSGGRIVAIIVGLGVLAAIGTAAVLIVLYVFGNQVVDQIEDQIQTPGTVESTATVTEVVTPVATGPAAEVANSEVFTFRNIFEPLLKPLTATASPAEGAAGVTTTDTVTPTTSNTLYLDGVVTQDGVLMAQLRWNGQSYTLGANGVIPNSPWQVLRVSSTSVVMLYGENQVTLSVGQGITK